MFAQEGSITRIVVLVLIFPLVFVFNERLFAHPHDANKQGDFFEMSLEELMEVPVVISASRQARKIGELSVPVSVITADDIHYSGLTTIPEILQFVPGVDVRRLDRSRYIVGVRGLHGRFSDRTLVLINGRVAGNPALSTIEWSTFPVIVEDIERIEVVRGPGGAAWGANAFTGVINIITKKPKDVQGYFASATFNEFGDSYNHIRWGGNADKWTWRLSTGYEDFEDSDAAGAGRFISGTPALNALIGFDTYSARDFSRNWRFDTEAVYQYSDQTRYSFGAGYANFQTGDHEFVGYFPKSDFLTSTTRVFSRIDHIFDDRSSGHLQWYGNFVVSHPVNLIKRLSYSENDIEGQFNFKVGDKHDISLGGNLRWTRINTTAGDNSNEMVFHGEPYDERSAGLFVINRFRATERLTLENQVRADSYSETHGDWALRSSALYALDQAKDHTMRFSFARAFRTPPVGCRRTTSSSISGLFNTFRPLDDLRNEGTWSIEGGYIGKVAKGVTLNVNSYYQRFDHLVGVDISTVGPVTNSTFNNVGGGNAYGTEFELAMENKRGKLSAWYAYQHFNTDEYEQVIRAYHPSRHKSGLTGRLFLPDDWTLNANYAYNDSIPGLNNAVVSAHPFHRLDLTIAKKFADGNGEFMIGVADVLNNTNDPVFGIGEFAAHETPGRTFFIRLQFNF